MITQTAHFSFNGDVLMSQNLQILLNFGSIIVKSDTFGDLSNSPIDSDGIYGSDSGLGL